MKVIYGKNVYSFEGHLDCLYFSNLIEEGIGEVELSMFEEVFKGILNKSLNFEEEKDYITLYQGLSYFGSKKEKELIKYIRKKIYDKEKKELQREITDFLEERLEFINWTYLCGNPSIPFEFFVKHYDKIDDEWEWCALCENTNIPVDFFKANLRKLNHECWENLCANPSIPVEFFEENWHTLDNVCWHNLCENPSIPFEFFKENLNKIDDWAWLCKNPSIPLEFFKENLDKIYWFWLCLNPSIPIEFFKENLNKLDEYCWKNLCQNPSIPLDFFKENLDKVEWSALCKNTSIPVEFFKEHVDKIYWPYLCQNLSIPLEFFKENLDKVDWESLCKNPNIPIEFFKENIFHVNDYLNILLNPNITIDILRLVDPKCLKKSNIWINNFNLHKKILDKMKNTIYFDCKQLNDLVIKNEK